LSGGGFEGTTEEQKSNFTLNAETMGLHTELSGVFQEESLMDRSDSVNLAGTI
jgi:hypothetical protein